MQIKLARFISVVLHPVIMPSIGLLLLFNAGTYLDFLTYTQKKAIFFIFLSGTTVLPLSIIPVMFFQRMISNLSMENRHERVLPLLITLIFYVFTWYTLSRFNVPGLILVYTITASLSVLFCALVSLKWLISLHMTALGALVGMLLAVSFRFNINLMLYLSAVFLAGGMAGWARLKLQAHTPAQVYAGYIGGVAIAFFIISIF